MRERLLSKVISELKLNHTFFLSLPSDAIFMFIMESQDKVVVSALADYLWVAFKLRNQQLTQALQNTVKSVKRRKV
jgi:hypothetical protein